MGVAAGTEILSQTAAERLSGLISWACIGARTTESQNHREWASAFSMPVGFKNGTDGNLDTAINALLAASASQVFVGNDPFGVTSKVFSRGNRYCHIVLRGGKRPNYDPVSISEACKRLSQHPSLLQSVIVDCSHKNSGKDYRKQGEVFNHVLIQRVGHTNGIHIKPNKAICGMMLESNVEAGSQPFVYGENPQRRPQSLCFHHGCLYRLGGNGSDHSCRPPSVVNPLHQDFGSKAPGVKASSRSGLNISSR
jgi:3-deoxy-7-phosphoheptulonate synthase